MSVTIEKKGAVFTVVLDRPEVKNAVNKATAEALVKAFREFEADGEALVAVLWGAGGTFCAGADLKAIAKDGTQVTEEGEGPMGPTRMRLSKPVIAAVSGFAVAGGLELAVWCDLRVVEQSAVFGVYCRRWGVPLVDGGTVRLPRLIGMSHALDMIMTGRGVNAEEARIMGLANRVVADGTARAEAEALAAQIAAFPQVCMRNDRQSAYDQLELSHQEAMMNETQLGLVTLSSVEAAEGAARFTSGEGRGGKF